MSDEIVMELVSPNFQRKNGSGSVLKKQPRPLVNCPYCDYTCKGKQPLGKHITFSHPEVRGKTYAVSKQTVVDLLHLVSEWLNKPEAHNSGKYNDLLQAVKEQDIKLRVAIRIIAAHRIARAAKLCQMIDQIDSSLQEGMETFAKNASVSQKLEVQSILQATLKSDLDFMKDVMNVCELNADAFSRNVIRVLESKSISIVDQAYKIPASSLEREDIRSIVSSLIGADGRSLLKELEDLRGNGDDGAG